jgi:Zn-dependent peptidase ImmA (M78 family)
MPAAKIREDAPSSPSLDQLILLKTVWGVPPGVMAHRLHELELLSDWQYRTLRIEIAKRGERKDGPAGEPRETSLLLQKVIAALRAQGIAKRTITGVLHIYPKDVDELAFG